MRTTLLLIFSMCFLTECRAQTSARGTIVSFARTRDTIVVAVDSKVTITHSFEAPDSVFSADKIRLHGNSGYVIAGLMREVPGFNTYEIADSICAKTADIHQRAEMFDEVMSPLLHLVWQRTIALGDTVHLMEKNVFAVFFGFFHDTAMVSIKMLVPKRQVGQLMPVIDKRTIISPSPSLWTPFHIGAVPKQTQAFDERLYATGILLLPTWVDRVRGIVRLGIEMFPDKNGDPIEIVCVTRGQVERVH